MSFRHAFFFITFQVFGQYQATLRGKVALEDDIDFSGVIIQIRSYPVATTLHGFTTSDYDGNYEIKVQKPGKYSVYFKQFAYVDTTINIQIKDTDNFYKLDVFLKINTFDLPGVSIIDRIEGMRRRGDTLYFNTKHFSIGSERTVADLIENIPLLDYNGSSLYYGNKPIRALLLDGKELAGDNHLQFSDMVQLDRVQDVYLLENYQTFTERILNDTIDDSYAVEITLKEKALV